MEARACQIWETHFPLWISGVVSSGLSGTIQRRREYHAALLLSLAFSSSAFVVAIFVVVSAFVVVAAGFGATVAVAAAAIVELTQNRSTLRIHASPKCESAQ